MSTNEVLPNRNFLPRLAFIFCVAAGALINQSASAFYLPLLFNPESPNELQTAQVIIRVGQCDFVTVNNPQDRIVTVDGQTIRVQINGFTNAIVGDICNFPPATVPIDLIPVPAGTYTVEIYRRMTLGPPVIDLMVSGNLVVGPAPAPPPLSIPTGSLFGLALLAFLLVFASVRAKAR